MNTLTAFVFAPDAIEEMAPLFAYLQRQRRGFNGWGRDESPRLHNMLLGAQKGVLDHVMHPNVLNRLTDTALYGNTFTADKMMGRLTDAIFKADIKGDVNSYRRNLQVEYVDRLIAMSGLEKSSSYDNFAKATAMYELNRVMDMVKKSRGDKATKIHKAYLKDRIERAFYKG